MKATIGKHPTKAGVWCVLVTCHSCHGTGNRAHSATMHLPAMEYDPCDCWGGKVPLSTHSTRDGAAVSCNQVNRA